MGLCAPGSVRLPLLPAPEAPVAAVKAEASAPAPAQGLALPVAGTRGGEATSVSVPPKPVHPGTSTDWTPLVLGVLLVWLGGVMWQARELLRGLVQLRHIRREARPLEDASLHQAAATLARELGLSRVPQLLVSERAPSPLALGMLRPEVILPRKALETLSPLEQRMALAHELAHVRRGDLWLGWVPALARTVFFFHPLVRRACREYALAREEACDAAALQATGAAPREYGRLLLIFGVARAPAAAAAPGASSHLAALKRRIAMLEHADTESKQHHRWARWTLGGLALVALVPFQVVARETPVPAQAPALATRPTGPVEPLQPTLAVPGKLSVGPARVAVAAPPALPAKPSVPAPVPVAAAAVPAKPPAPPAAPEVRHMDSDDDDDNELSYVLIRSPDSATMSGSTRDLRVARSLAGDGKQPLLYVRRDDQEYVIRDAATLKIIEDTVNVTRELGKKQGELGQKQAEIGQKQAEIGMKQAEVGSKQAAVGAKQAAVGARLGELARRHAELNLAQARQEQKDGKESPELERQEKELEREQDALEREMDEYSRQMDAFSREMEPLSDEMEKLGEPMEEYGRQMEEFGRQMEKQSHEANKKVQSLLEDAIHKGLAEPVKH
ncbi:M56 family metallopeptidase [Vitiosangium sp. GDMCC 1.1324]|uniref:M56 family metallopeptidase n=1 Tax=Vitiosangium sp. (strain GDMCC 1.1324) TaxID=2138576 RepID=UPI000D3A5F6D|nr:M56 family metallopeptidase [Vitiosangium sp. GDMCC 1.1324]PTL79998.1 biotin transporter BioY [Vitiosangium sp. GDMCC 1.1324]